ncbi:glycosyltransferase family 2 protein [Nocardioides baculatus]|uniref:Glycosyltransferase n=1 Tax=Nocardioides baculatus TaxID=2801337 RepID=A0ABS1LBR9_9ACTN|nr:glycosyltransferase [Nocardioides baculatus]MBL0749141.1 glycosyltransferase [Nocardioides baculatus]
MPDVAISVVVPTRGGVSRLPGLLEALARQDLADPWEVIVVLDGEVDGSRALLEEYADRLPLRVITREGSNGVAAALAAGYAEAGGEIVLRCDDDLSLPRGLLAGHLAWHRDRSHDAAPLGVISLTRDVFEDSPYAESYGRPANARLLSEAYSRPADERWRHWAACNSVPKAAYDAAGGFDLTMGYREDSELGFRLARSGVEIVIDPALEVEHRGPAPDTAARAARAFTSGASALDLEARHPGTRPTTTKAGGPWSRAVAAAADRIDSRTSAAALGARVDAALPRMPRRVRGKAVAWVVEAAAVAGGRVGDSEWVRHAPSAIDSVSVVVPHHGDPTPTLALLDQLAVQTHPVQVIVADDASPQPFPDRPGIQVVRRRSNGGFGANVNSGADAATGDAVLVLNSDLTIEPTFVAEMVAAARMHPSAVLAPRMVDEHGQEAWVGRDFPRVRHQVAAWLTPLARFRGTSAWHRAVGHDVRAHGAEAEVDWVVGAAMWIPTAEFRAVGGFDERFFMNSEEVDLQLRLRGRGVKAVALRTPTVVHEGGGSSPSESRRRWLVQGQMLYAAKWGSRRRLQAALTAATAANFVVNSMRQAAGRQIDAAETARIELSLIRGRR